MISCSNTNLLNELKKLVKASEKGDLNFALNDGGSSGEEAEIASLLNKVINNYRAAIEYDLMKYKLTSDTLGIALWDMNVVSEDPINLNNKFTWSQEFRNMLGFDDESDFPNVLHSWSDRLHPEDKERTLSAFAAHLNDHTGKTPYDLEYRLMLKNGHYRNFRAFGTSQRDAEGIPFRVAGALEDITEKKRIAETLTYRKKLLDALDEMDIMLLSHKSKTFNNVMSDSLKPIVDTADLSRIVIYNIVNIEAEKRFGQIYSWDKAEGGMISLDEKLKILPYIPAIEKWIVILSKNSSVNIHTSIMSKDEIAFLSAYGVKSMLLTPVFVNNKLWGAIAFQDHINERNFDSDTINFLSSAARLCANAIIRHEKTQSTEKAMEALKHRERMTSTLNNAAVKFLSQTDDATENTMTSGVKLIVGMVDVDRFSLWRNTAMPDGLHTSQIYRWDKEAGGTTTPTAGLEDVTYAKLAPRWEGLFKSDETINSPASLLPEAAMLKSFGVVSAYVTPLFINNEFWGFALFEDRHNARYFDLESTEMMRSAAHLCANAIIRTEMEREITEANEFNRTIAEASPISYILFDENWQAIDCNNVATQIFGSPSKQYLLDNYWEKFSPELQPDGQKSHEKINTVLDKTSNKERGFFEWHHQTLDGELLPMENTITPFTFKNKKFAISFKYDMRNIKKMMNSIQEQSKILAFQLEQQKLVSEISKNFISFGDTHALINKAISQLGKNFNVSRMLILSVDYNLADVNIEYQWRADSSVPKFQSKHNFDIFGIVTDIFPKNLSEGTMAPTISCENTADDKIFHALKIINSISFICTPLYVESNLWGFIIAENCFAPRKWTEDEISFFSMTSSIISGAIMRNIYETKLKETIIKVTNLSKAKDEFLSKISHEIRTPMNAILGITEIQLLNETLPQGTREGLSIIYNSGDSLLRIINDLLDLSKIEAKKLEIIPAKYEIASLINDTTQLNIMRIESKPIEFKLEVNENIPTELLGDELRIKQVLNNILSNAFKYTDSGEVFMSVAAEKNEDENFNVMLVFSISDTGHGMTEEQLRKLFDEYSRFNLASNNTIEGTGLGMTITQSLVNLMSGSISAESEPGKGSVFTVRLPQKKVGTKVLGKELAENLQKFRVSSSSQIKKIKIIHEPMPYGKVLVVDDVESNLYVAKHLLDPYDLSLEMVSSGFEAIDKIKSGKVYDIIFMDHMMPKMDGIETVKKIRELGYASPIIALTANAVAGQSDIFLENGFDGFISKPVDTYRLNLKLNKLIRDKQPPEILAEARKLKSKKVKSDIHKNTMLHSIFVQDAKKTLPIFESTLKNIEDISSSDLHLFVIKAHAMKSAFANIGETALSQFAFALENAGREGDKSLIKKQTQKLIDALQRIISEIEAKTETAATYDENTDYLHEQLKAISKACENYDARTANAAFANLKEMLWTRETKTLLDKIGENLLLSDFDEANAEISLFTSRFPTR
ncbi:MAG: ATP-binding protein [Fibromonadales bacterium]|nr:ATP-binding protein [Fibromonadales bacterium]